MSVSGKAVCVTGKMGIKRELAEAQLTKLGATIRGSVSKNVDILFVGTDAGSKLEKAEALGIQIIDEAGLMAILAGAGKDAASSASEAVEGTESLKDATAEKAPKTIRTRKAADSEVDLFKAIADGKIPTVSKALATGLDVNLAEPKTGRLLLHAAARAGQPEIVQMLIEHGADPNAVAFTRTALSIACSFGFLLKLYPDQYEKHAPPFERVVDLLLAAGADPNIAESAMPGVSYAPVAAAATHGTSVMVRTLLDHGGRCPAAAMPEVFSRGRYDDVSLIVSTLDPGALDTVLFDAIVHHAKRMDDVVRALLEAGANCDARGTYGETPLHHAAKGAHPAIAALLLQAGAKPDVPTTAVWGTRPVGVTALSLLEAGALNSWHNRSIRPSPSDSEERERWSRLAELLGHEHDAWIASLRVAIPVPGEWRVESAIKGNVMMSSALGESGPRWRFDEDGKATLSDPNDMMGGSLEARWAPLAESPDRAWKVAPPIAITIPGENRSRFQLGWETRSTLQLSDLERKVTWHFAPASVSLNTSP